MSKDIVQKEHRTKDNLFKIYLYYEGIFWHSYEWSAYLCHNFPINGVKSEKPLVPTKKNENGDTIVMVGLKLDSFDKYFPGVRNNEKIFSIKDKEIVIDAEEYFRDSDFDNYEKILNEWKDSLKLKEKRKKKEFPKKSFDNDSFLEFNKNNNVLQMLSNVQCEKMTPIDALIFLSKMKTALRHENNT